MSIPTHMQAAVITRAGSPEVLELQSRPVPEPGHEDVLVRVMASALNRADLSQRAGRYPAPPGWPPDIPGLEFAGEVVACGHSTSLYTPGDRVFGLVGGGAHAEYLTAHERTVVRIPDAMSWLVAGATPEAFITAHDALVSQAALRPGEQVLIHAVGSGVGLAATQLVRALGGIPFGTARNIQKIEAARSCGLEQGHIAASVESIAPQVMLWTNGRGVNVVLDLVGGEYVAASLASLAPRGRLMVVGSMAGRQAALDLGTLMSRRIAVRGTVLRARPLEERIVATQAFAREVVPWLASGVLQTRVDATYDLAEIRKAHERLESNETIGKVVIRIGSP